MEKSAVFRGFLPFFCIKFVLKLCIIFQKMEIYLEDAIVENLLVDGALLYLALSASAQPVCFWRLTVAACLGTLFALLYPYLSLPSLLGYALKLLMGALLCLIALKKQKNRGRYALTIGLFYALSFCFGGGLIAVFSSLGVPYVSAVGGGVVTSTPVGWLLAALAVFVGLIKLGVKKLYARKRERAHIVYCKVTRGRAELTIFGFVDTGNRAIHKGRAVCFIRPDLLYRLFGAMPPSEWLTVRTVSGEKSVGLYPVDKVEILDKSGGQVWNDAYLSPAVHMVGKEYAILLPEG